MDRFGSDDHAPPALVRRQATGGAFGEDRAAVEAMQMAIAAPIGMSYEKDAGVVFEFRQISHDIVQSFGYGLWGSEGEKAYLP